MDTNTIAIIILISSFVLLILLRFPIALTLIISSLITVIYLGVPLANYWSANDSGNEFLFVACHSIFHSNWTNYE